MVRSRPRYTSSRSDLKACALLRLFSHLVVLIIIYGQFASYTQINAYDCMPYQKIDDNDLTIYDIVIKGNETVDACVKARFALAFKIEEKRQTTIKAELARKANGGTNASLPAITEPNIFIGYVKIGNVIRAEHNCPKDDKYNVTGEKTKTFLMMVEFECGSFNFVFERDDSNQKYSLLDMSGEIRFGLRKFFN